MILFFKKIHYEIYIYNYTCNTNSGTIFLVGTLAYRYRYKCIHRTRTWNKLVGGGGEMLDTRVCILLVGFGAGVSHPSM